jgi:site-specific recombinase
MLNLRHISFFYGDLERSVVEESFHLFAHLVFVVSLKVISIVVSPALARYQSLDSD